ncbi:phosphoketolase [Bradyrhizobium sp. JR3.5]
MDVGRNVGVAARIGVHLLSWLKPFPSYSPSNVEPIAAAEVIFESLESDMQSATTPNEQARTNDLELLDRYWRAANYLSVGQIYLLANPLLKEPLKPEHIKPRLLGHWGTTPGLNFIYAHLNRAIRTSDLNVIYICGPGHGGPGMVANTYLEGTYTEIYPEVTRDADGLRKLFRQFSFPGGIPSHAAPETPGSIHEGGELGYALVHAYGAVFDNPDLIAVCVVGDGEAETGPLAASWHSNKFLNPVHDGAVLPILHLNGYKIANPTVLGRMDDEEVRSLFIGYGYEPLFVEGDDPHAMHRLMADTLDTALAGIRSIQQAAHQQTGGLKRPRWPMIVLRSPKGWTGPKEVDGLKVEGFWRAHQVPIANPRGNPEHLKLLEHWMSTYEPDKLFDSSGRLVPELQALAPAGHRRMGANPHANGGLLKRELKLPDFRAHAVEVTAPGDAVAGSHARTRQVLARGRGAECGGPQFPHHGSGRNRIQPARRGLRGHRPGLDGGHRTL